MQITGTNHLSVDPATAWEAFHDAGVLERSLPGAQSLREVGPGRFAMTVTAGVAAIKGTYDGEAVFSQETEPESFVLSLSGAGGPGTVNADVEVRLSQADEGGTDLAWTADATVGGPVGGVGQRMLSSVAKRLATQFFTNIDKDLARGGSAAAEEAGQAEAGGPDTDAVAPARPLVAGSASSGGSSAGAVGPAGASGQLVPMVTGAAIALVGVALGARLRRR
ncbi:SRPBCC family protein [Ornithinimicrobium kibberense]|uniref:Carbon monoxide dehydrogenase subunit G n=1 Tax=Ornithinimicrobium kibberense TaxID=282060 RepID=A0ABV5V1P7_9MICO|nr:carbon monoxide dehydrogenase subunit G [Ornithinimicrobium kibberense]